MATSRRRTTLLALATALTTALTTALATALVAGLGVAAAPAQAHAGGRVTVLTRNLYLGGSLTPSITAPTLPEFMAANAALLSHVDLMNFPARAKLFANEIARHRPDLVGLQEVALWRTGPLGDPAPAVDVRYDYLALLRRELARAGQRYEVRVVQVEADLEGPASAPHHVDMRLTMRDVILVRHRSGLRVTGSSAGNFTNNLTFTLPSTGTTAVSRRGWTAVDLTHGRRRALRFVNTHLEAFHPGIRNQQAQELLDGPLSGGGGGGGGGGRTGPGRRVILAGDLNTGPELPEPDNRIAYFTLVTGGMVDTWPILHPGDPGYTASLGADLNEPADQIEHRIDMVMFRGAVLPVSSRLSGTHRKTPDGRWASDHLGHVAVLALR